MSASWKALCAFATLVAGTALSACGAAPDQSQAATVFVVTTATTNEPGPQLPIDFNRVLKAANNTQQGTLTVLMPRAGRVDVVGDPVSVKVLRDGTNAENNAQLIEKGLKEISSDIESRLTTAASNEPVLDLLTGLNDAARRAPKSTIVVLSSGVQSTGLLDLAGLGWDFPNASVIDNLRSQGFLPKLDDKKVLFVGLGDTAGAAQMPLPEPMRAKVESLWLDICRASSAAECALDQAPSTAPTLSTAPAKVVPVPVFALPSLPTRGTVDLNVPTAALFAPDSADLLPQADRQLKDLAVDLTSRNASVALVGHTWSIGPADSARELSQQRAQAVADALTRHGLPAQNISSVKGVGYDDLISPPGADATQTAEANRVVVITARLDG